MIIISQDVYKVIDEYTKYLVQEGLTSNDRANQKRRKIIQSIHSNLGGILTHRPSLYSELGKDENCLLYVYRDTKSKTQWGFAYKRFENDNVIVHYMKNLKLVKEI